MTTYDVLERAIASAVEDQPSLMVARAEWERLAGIVHSDEALYEERAAAFLEWFLIDYRADDPDRPTAIDRQIARQIGAADGTERVALSALAASQCSVFQVRELFPDGLLLDDLWGGGLFRVRERRHLAGLAPGELFEARLVADFASPPDLVFARTFCFHPREAEEGVRKQIEAARRAGERREQLLFCLLRLRVRCERYRHVAPLRVYNAGET